MKQQRNNAPIPPGFDANGECELVIDSTDQVPMEESCPDTITIVNDRIFPTPKRLIYSMHYFLNDMCSEYIYVYNFIRFRYTGFIHSISTIEIC